MAREKYDADESSLVENIANRNRTLKPSIPQEEPSKEASVPLPMESEPMKEKEMPREESKRRRSKAQPEIQDYEALFFKESAIKTRSGKVVYIRKEYHDRILKIVRVIGDNEFSLFSYLDNVLEHHFNTFQDEITELYRTKNTDVF